MDVCCSRVVRRHVRMRISWDASGLTEEKELSFNLWEKLKLTPKVNGHGRGTTAEDPNEMILEGLDGFFGHVALVFFRGN